jgi:hypothetical protein
MKKFNLFIILSFWTINSFACICLFPNDKKNIKSIIGKADMIIYATAEADSSSKAFKLGDSTLNISDIIFKVTTTWKGKKLKTVRLKAKRSPCEDAEYIVGERYLIFAYYNEETGEFETNNCRSLSEETTVGESARDYMKSSHFDSEDYKLFIINRKELFKLKRTLIIRQTKN